MSLPAPLRRLRQGMGFCALFTLCLGGLALVFDRLESLFGVLYLRPVSWAGALLLDLVGVSARLDSATLASGYCVIDMERTVFHVTYECTGVFALLIYMAAVLAYPASGRTRLRGVVAGVPAFFAYSAVRLLVLGLVAHLAPDWTQFFHLYLLVFMNVGFMLFVWSSWVNRLAPTDAGGTAP
jgi:exosortase/archaeosortase family protein